MNEKQIVGKENVDYTNKQNRQVTGVKLHLMGKDKRVEGTCVETVFISSRSAFYDDVLSTPLGTVVTLTYNRWGNVEGVVPCADKK